MSDVGLGPADAADAGARPGAARTGSDITVRQPESGDANRFNAVWDESTRPVAPPNAEGEAPAGSPDAIGGHLVAVHDHLRHELRQVRDLLEQVGQGSVPVGQARAALNDMTMRRHDWTLGAYCANYCSMLTQHHTIEDRAVFPHLRRSDPGLAPVIDRLEQEHGIIHELIEHVDRALVRLVEHPGDYTELQKAVDVLTDALLSHLAYEEQQIVGPLGRYGLYPGQL